MTPANVETNGRDERAWDSFHRCINKGRRAFVDWRSEIQAQVFRRQWKTDFMDAKFHNMSYIAGFQCHAIQNKNQNHSIDQVQIPRKERR